MEKDGREKEREASGKGGLVQEEDTYLRLAFVLPGSVHLRATGTHQRKKNREEIG